jgi:glycine/serine hydroxymethyltransferase
MTNNEMLHNQLETTINPIYIRHTQMHQKVSLLFALTEFEIFGKAYEERIVELSNALADELCEQGFTIGKAEKRYTCTHEIFIYTDKQLMERIYNNGIRFGITMNKKQKKLFGGCGIRLGTQEIARYGWSVDSMKQTALVIREISKESIDEQRVYELISGLPEKKIQYTFDDNVCARFREFG